VVVTADGVIADLAQLTNFVTMTSVETGSLTASVPVTVHAVDLAVSKVVAGDPALAGDPITYTITLINAGHADAGNVRITTRCLSASSAAASSSRPAPA